MLKKRIIVCLDVKDGEVTKGVKFLNNKVVGDAVKLAKFYYEKGADELVFYDIMASANNYSPIIPLIKEVAGQVFIPFCVGGGIKTIKDIDSIIKAGAEKISLNSAAVRNPLLIKEASNIYGRQCIVLGVDAKKGGKTKSGYEVYIDGGRVNTHKDLLEWTEFAVKLGAGEIVLNSIDKDGTKEGYDIKLTSLVSDSVNVPVVASGGAGSPQDIARVLKEGRAQAALVAGILHSGLYTVRKLKEEIAKEGVSVRNVY